jgi:hypothetical protein
MYLREMGSVELLSREGEIAIAKRIEAGREAMIAGLCESPLTSRPSSFGATPAAAGISNTLWSVTDLAEMVDASTSKPGKRGPYKRRPHKIQTETLPN